MPTDKGDDGDAEKSDVVMVINCVTHLQKGNFETPHWEMAQCSITTLKKGCLQPRMGGNFNPGAEVENQGISPANSPSDNPSPLQYSQRAIVVCTQDGYWVFHH